MRKFDHHVRISPGQLPQAFRRVSKFALILAFGSVRSRPQQLFSTQYVDGDVDAGFRSLGQIRGPGAIRIYPTSDRVNVPAEFLDLNAKVDLIDYQALTPLPPNQARNVGLVNALGERFLDEGADFVSFLVDRYHQVYSWADTLSLELVLRMTAASSYAST